ncbi:MAG: sigma-70 family RNA polymerase sigma factor [Actinobacteria bacterium]|nr:sigma-70 family RNA polymerase sigma factor [Actinomycetota bacterium]
MYAPTGQERGVTVTTERGARRAVDVGFEEFYARQHDRVFRALALTLRDRALAAEATDEAMVRAYQRWPQVSGYTNPGGWAYRVGLNWARSWQRKLRREVADEAVDRAGPSREVRLADPELDAAVGALPVEQRAVLVLRLYLDWSVSEVASALDLAEGTVKSRLARALDRLRGQLGGGGRDDAGDAADVDADLEPVEDENADPEVGR